MFLKIVGFKCSLNSLSYSEEQHVRASSCVRLCGAHDSKFEFFQMVFQNGIFFNIELITNLPRQAFN